MHWRTQFAFSVALRSTTWVVVQNHQPDLISTSLQKTAAQKNTNARPIWAKRSSTSNQPYNSTHDQLQYTSSERRQKTFVGLVFSLSFKTPTAAHPLPLNTTNKVFGEREKLLIQNRSAKTRQLVELLLPNQRQRKHTTAPQTIWRNNGSSKKPYPRRH